MMFLLFKKKQKQPGIAVTLFLSFLQISGSCKIVLLKKKVLLYYYHRFYV